MLFFSFLVALSLTMILMAPLLKWAGRLGLIDRPTKRKRHVGAVPRCGGIALAAGTLTSVLLWVPVDRTMAGLIAGSLIIVVFGILDDRFGLAAKWKLMGQLVAALILIRSGFVIQHFPLFGLDPVPDVLAYPVTILFLLGVTNAFNLSDGLDGLTGGFALVTLAVIAILANEVGSVTVLVPALAAMGGILGFLRFNTHPAIVFLGDAGSQFLGFVAGALTILLVEKTHSALSPVIPLFILGLPIFDMLWVIARRISEGRSPLTADRNHVHFKLLGLGFGHNEAVSLLYLLHTCFALLALFLKYQSDVLLTLIYTLFCLSIVAFFHLARFLGWAVRHTAQDSPRGNGHVPETGWVGAVSRQAKRFVAYGSGAFLIGGALLVRDVSLDFAIVASALIVTLFLVGVLMASRVGFFSRVGLYVASVLVVYLLVPLPELAWLNDEMLNLFIGGILIGMIVAIRTAGWNSFQVTSQDFLIAIFVLVAPSVSRDIVGDFPLGQAIFRLAVLFYCVEFLMNGDAPQKDRHSYIVLRVAAFACLSIIGFKGFVGIA